MLELSKNILKKVSFDADLFKKELKKALTWITDLEDLSKFREWCIQEFGKVYPHLITQVFHPSDMSSKPRLTTS